MPKDADIEEFAGAVIALVNLIKRGQAKAFDTDLVAVTQLLAEGQALLPSEIAEALGSPRSSVSRHIQALQSKGKVKIQPEPGDKRSYRVSLSPSGKQELDELSAKGLRLFAAWVSGWTTEEIQTFSMLARRLTAGVTPPKGERRRTAWWREQER
jgi:DNA-binding MarR family transcriptional regulator